MEHHSKIETTSIKKIKNFIIENSELNSHMEICGFIGLDKKNKKYICNIEKNQAADKSNYFIINPLNYLKFKKDYFLIAIFHSHIMGDESFSEFDIKTSEFACVPFMVYSINSKKFSFYEPSKNECNIDLVKKFKEKI
jgi:proteasome lid subunit RPN8/RPN11